MSDEIAYATIRELGTRYRRRELSPVEVTRALLARIEKLDTALRAFVTLTTDRALAEARAAEEALRRGDTSPLLGIPVAPQAIYPTRGLRLGHRRVRARAGRLLWHRGAQADVRAREPRGGPHALVDARPHRPDGAHGGGLRVPPAGHGGSRSRRSGLESGAGRRLPGAARSGRPWPPDRRAARVLLRGDRSRRRAGVRRGARDAPPARRRGARRRGSELRRDALVPPDHDGRGLRLPRERHP